MLVQEAWFNALPWSAIREEEIIVFEGLFTLAYLPTKLIYEHGVQ